MDTNDNTFLKDMLSLDKMITPSLIKIIYYIGMVFAILSGLSMGIYLSNSFFLGLIPGLILAIAFFIINRVNCELLIVIFNIYNTLKDIERKI